MDAASPGHEFRRTASIDVRYTTDAHAFHAPWEVRANSLYGLAIRRGVFIMDEGLEAQHEPTCDVRFRSANLWPDTCDEALVHVGVFESDLRR